MFQLYYKKLYKIIKAEAMEHFAGDSYHENHEFLTIIMVVAMALAASTCIW